LALNSSTIASSLIAPLNRTVPVALAPPTIDVGTKETDVSEGRAACCRLATAAGCHTVARRS
jgi:hypothetical protein